jgi:hypothetical protein
MLRISEVATPNPSVTLRLEGRMAGPWVEEARQVCERILTSGRALKLDLAEVEFLDATGAALLERLRSQGVRLVACSPFVQTCLKTPPAWTGWRARRASLSVRIVSDPRRRGLGRAFDPQLLHSAAQRAGVEVQEPGRAALAFDHPIGLAQHRFDVAAFNLGQRRGAIAARRRCGGQARFNGCGLREHGGD